MKDLIIHFFTLPIGKRTRIVLYVFQGLFSIIFASIIYKHFFKDHQVIEITNYSAIISFILSGRILLCIFFTLLSWWLFYSMGYLIIKFVNKKLVKILLDYIWKWVKKKARESNEDVENNLLNGTNNMLLKVGAIKMDDGKIKQKGESYKEYVNVTQSLKELASDKRYLMPYLFLAMIFQLNIIYFNFMNEEVNSWILDLIMLSIFLFYLISFFLTVFIIEILVRLGSLVESGLQIRNK